jgi:ABC-type uncharacterized transport system permease subunit
MTPTPDMVGGFAGAAVRVATPLLLAATGELIAERAGVINLSIEGAMLCGALAAAIAGVSGGPWIGLLFALLAGMALAALFAAVAVGAGADQIISGTAFTLLATGLTGAVYRRVFGTAGSGLSLQTFRTVDIPFLRSIPILGPGLFSQPVVGYLAMLAVPATWWVLFRSRAGLALRATGESMEAAQAAGVSVRRIRTIAVVIGGGMAGLAGGSLVLAQVGTFAEQMTAGRGFIAIAIVALGGWRPFRVALAALLFGTASALQYVFQALGLAVPYQLFLMLPYLVTLLARAGMVGRVRAPEGLGR